MESRRRSLLLLIAIGGTAVLASYALAFVWSPASADALWGDLPQEWHGFYTVNMWLAAIGFFPVTFVLGWKTPLDAFATWAGASWSTMMRAYAAILIPSALWLPLTALHVEDPSPLLWIAIRIVLFLVGGGASVLGYMLIRRARRGPALVWAAVASFFFFWLQTMVLDALVWPVYF